MSHGCKYFAQVHAIATIVMYITSSHLPHIYVIPSELITSTGVCRPKLPWWIYRNGSHNLTAYPTTQGIPLPNTRPHQTPTKIADFQQLKTGMRSVFSMCFPVKLKINHPNLWLHKRNLVSVLQDLVRSFPSMNWRNRTSTLFLIRFKHKHTKIT